jgi:stage V sporulation protein D (sporulation-specific penicillin-binding protein)
MNSNLIRRIRIVVISVLIFALVIVLKLFSVQVINGDEYTIKADRQYVRETNTALLDRGSIFFSSKDDIKIAAATIKDGYNLSINPKIIKNPEQIYEALSQYLEIDRDKFLEKASQASSSYKEIQRRLDIETGESIRQLRVPGVVVSKESWRIYPGDSLASNAIGIIGLDKKNNLEGRYGLESYYEDILSRKSF